MADNRVRSLLAAVAVVLLLTGCRADDHDSDPTCPAFDSLPIAPDHPPFRPLDRDQPGGPRNLGSYAARPTLDELTAAARDGSDRRAAETFAILVNHALEDQTTGSFGDSVVADFGAEVPCDATQTIDEIRSFPSSRIAPGSRSFLRSSRRTTDRGAETVVYIVEKITSPDLFEAHKRFVYWAQTRLTLAWADERWTITDYDNAGASERPKFSKWTWRDTMDSGRDWRRFDVASTT